MGIEIFIFIFIIIFIYLYKQLCRKTKRYVNMNNIIGKKKRKKKETTTTTTNAILFQSSIYSIPKEPTNATTKETTTQNKNLQFHAITTKNCSSNLQHGKFEWVTLK